MKPEFLEFLACPRCGSKLQLEPQSIAGHRIETGNLSCEHCGLDFPISRFIPRFVSSDQYVRSFSFEWNRFRTTQLDSANGTEESEQRFRQNLDFPVEELDGKLVLDAGCGMGRFVEIVVKYGGTIVGVDLSLAVDAAHKNLGHHPLAHFAQADIFQLPLKEGTFDFIYSIGVLHHTPDPQAAFQGLVRFLKPGGRISISLYAAYNKVYVASTTFWRKLTTRMPQKLVYYLSHMSIPLYYFYKTPFVGLPFKSFLPVSLHPDPEWRVLDTFDLYTPTYQSYHTHYEVFQWFKEVGLKDISVLEPGISFIATK